MAIVTAQAVSVIIIRWFSYKSFFTKKIKQKLNSILIPSNREVIRVIYPNAVKIGLTSVGGFMVQRSAILIGSLFLPLTDNRIIRYFDAAYLHYCRIGGIYTGTYQPKIAQLRVLQDIKSIKDLYLKGQFVLLILYYWRDYAPDFR